MDATTTYVPCLCSDHLVVLEAWDDGDLYMRLWSPVQSKEWGRFHWAWQSLRGRWSGNQDLVMDAEATEKLRDALTAHLEREKP